MNSRSVKSMTHRRDPSGLPQPVTVRNNSSASGVGGGGGDDGGPGGGGGRRRAGARGGVAARGRGGGEAHSRGVTPPLLACSPLRGCRARSPPPVFFRVHFPPLTRGGSRGAS